MTKKFSTNTIVIGAGPFSIFTAYKLADNGKNVIILEKGDEIGGAWKGHRMKNYGVIDSSPHIIEPPDSEYTYDKLAEIFEIEFSEMQPVPEIVLKNRSYPTNSKAWRIWIKGIPNFKTALKFIYLLLKEIIFGRPPYLYFSAGSQAFVEAMENKIRHPNIQIF